MSERYFVSPDGKPKEVVPAVSELNQVLGRIGNRLNRMDGSTGMPAFNTTVDMQGNRLQNLADPVDPGDALSMSFADERYAQQDVSGNFSGTIPESAVIGLIDDLAGKVPTSRKINTTLPLTGGGDLTTDRTLAINNMTGDTGAGGATGAVPAPPAGSSAGGQFLKADGTWAVPPGVGGGTVTSVGLTAPAEFTVSGSPVTGSGTLALAKANETANTVWAGPSTGSPAVPAFRGLVAADIQTALSSGAFRLNRIFNITASGTYTPTAGTRALYVECVGGGGAGGGAAAVSASASGGAGGGGGAYSAVFLTGAIKASYSVQVGAGGTGVAAGTGNNGADSTFDSPSVCTAKGGLGGASLGAGTTAAFISSGTTGGSAASGVGDLKLDGGDALYGQRLSGAVLLPGPGGNGPFGGVAMQIGGGNNNLAGINGKQYGGGGSGAENVGTNASTFAGGNGANGVIRVWEFA